LIDPKALGRIAQAAAAGCVNEYLEVIPIESFEIFHPRQSARAVPANHTRDAMSRWKNQSARPFAGLSIPRAIRSNLA
jgi:hypothetical protein